MLFLDDPGNITCIGSQVIDFKVGNFFAFGQNYLLKQP